MRLFAVLLMSLFAMPAYGEVSQCYGETKNGRLVNAKKLPRSGDNFESYSTLGSVAGRTYVHSAVYDITLSAYKSLYMQFPDLRFKYGETGFKKGGAFYPHKTHQNGLSVDFMVPVRDQAGNVAELPTHILNKWGYEVEFDEHGMTDDLVIDFAAVAAHIMYLHQAAVKSGHNIWRVIFAPELQDKLLATEYGDYLRKHIQFSKKRSWVRHDEHYHVDFLVPCLD